MTTDEPTPISPAARRALEEELAGLRTERETVVASLTDADTDSAGDSADQAEELQRATDLDRLDARIVELDQRLAAAATAPPPPDDRVGVGSTVTVRFDDGTQETVQIGDVAEALDQTLVTADSPLGQALLGHREGDTVDYTTPTGHARADVVSIGS